MKLHIKFTGKKLCKLSNKLEMVCYSYKFTQDLVIFYIASFLFFYFASYGVIWRLFFCLLGYFWVSVRAENFVGADAYRLATFVYYVLFYSFFFIDFTLFFGHFGPFCPEQKYSKIYIQSQLVQKYCHHGY